MICLLTYKYLLVNKRIIINYSLHICVNHITFIDNSVTTFVLKRRIFVYQNEQIIIRDP